MAKHKRSRGVESTTTWNKSSLWSEQGLNSVSAPDFESGAMFLGSPENFSYQKPVFKLRSACFEKLIFKHAFYVRKTKGTAKTSTWRRFKDGAYYCYCAYVLRISRYSDFLSPMLTNTGIFLGGLKLSGESRS